MNKLFYSLIQTFNMLFGSIEKEEDSYLNAETTIYTYYIRTTKSVNSFDHNIITRKMVIDTYMSTPCEVISYYGIEVKAINTMYKHIKSVIELNTTKKLLTRKDARKIKETLSVCYTGFLIFNYPKENIRIELHFI